MGVRSHATLLRNMEQPDLSISKEWSPWDLFDLHTSIECGNSVAEIATFLMRTETEVREKAAELRLKLAQ